VDFGHLPSRALMAHMLMEGREGVAQDGNRAFELAEEGARLCCHHCQGMMAKCYRFGYGCVKDAARSLELARESSGKGSRYGQYMLGDLYGFGGGIVAQDQTQAVALFRLAAAQNLDVAQRCLGTQCTLFANFTANKPAAATAAAAACSSTSAPDVEGLVPSFQSYLLFFCLVPAAAQSGLVPAAGGDVVGTAPSRSLGEIGDFS